MSVRLEQSYLDANRRLIETLEAYQRAIQAVEEARPAGARNRWQTTPELHRALQAATDEKTEAERAFQAAWKALVSSWCRQGQAVIWTDLLPDRTAGFDVIGQPQYMGQRMLPGQARVVGDTSGIVLIQVIPTPAEESWLVIGDNKLTGLAQTREIYRAESGTVLQIGCRGRWQDNGRVQSMARLSAA